MNLTLHLVRNDLVRMRVWLIGWLILLLLPIGVGAMLLGQDSFDADNWPWPDRLTILAGFQAMVGYVLTILLLQEHRIVGTNQFWLTRPISRGRLLGAKVIGVIVMVALLPVLVSLPWWLWCGLGAAQIAHAAVETFIVMMLVTLPAGVMAVLTDSLPRALLWTVVLVGVLLFGMMYFTIVNLATASSADKFSLHISRSIVAVAAIALLMVVVIVVQFFVRRRGWWLAAFALLGVVFTHWSFLWPRGWVGADPAEYNAARAESVKVEFKRANAGPPPRARRPGQEVFQEVHTHLSMSGVPRGFEAGGVGVRHEWQSGTGVVRRAERHWRTTWNTKTTRLEGGQANLAAAELRIISYLQPSVVARMQADPPKYHARLWWNLARAEFLFKVPIAVSARLKSAGRTLRITQVDRGPTYLKVTTVETRPVTLLGTLNLEARHRTWYHQRTSDDAVMYQIHHASGEFMNHFAHDLDPTRRVVVNGVEISRRRRAPWVHQLVQDGKLQPNRPAVDGDMIGAMIWHDEALFSRDVTVERFEITDRP